MDSSEERTSPIDFDEAVNILSEWIFKKYGAYNCNRFRKENDSKELNEDTNNAKTSVLSDEQSKELETETNKEPISFDDYKVADRSDEDLSFAAEVYNEICPKTSNQTESKIKENSDK